MGHYSGDNPHVHRGRPRHQDNRILQGMFAQLFMVPQSREHQPQAANSMAGDKLYRLWYLRKNLLGVGIGEDRKRYHHQQVFMQWLWLMYGGMSHNSHGTFG